LLNKQAYGPENDHQLCNTSLVRSSEQDLLFENIDVSSAANFRIASTPAVDLIFFKQILTSAAQNFLIL
jgi:hypothetical protein